MAVNSSDSEQLLARIKQLENERDALRKDIEQLCIQQAGPNYLVVATKMHFQRTSSLEQEIENLKKKLAGSTREYLNMQEELSETYRIKGQLADLHAAEVTKNQKAEKQLKFFQDCVAAACAERDHSILEAEKAKEKEDLMFQKVNEVEIRMENLNSDCLQQKRLIDSLKVDLAKQQDENEAFKKVVDMFYEIRQQSFQDYEASCWNQKCTCLLEDPPEVWSYNDLPTSKYISALEEELHSVKNSMDNLQNKLQVGLEIENHLKQRARELEKKKIAFDKIVKNSLAWLRHEHSLHKEQIGDILMKEKSYIKSMVHMIEEKIGRINGYGEADVKSSIIMKLDENYCADRETIVLDPGNASEKAEIHLPNSKVDTSAELVQALQEKVAALLLLSQQEERHLLEKNVNASLQDKVEELQRNLLQVTNEKVKALIELAQVRQDYHLLKEKMSPDRKGRQEFVVPGDKRLTAHEKEGKFRNILKKTYLSSWINKVDFVRNASETYYLTDEGNFSNRQSNQNMEYARMKIENATLKESLESVEHLTSTIHRLRISLSQVKESAILGGGTMAGVGQMLEEITAEATLVRTALSSCLPVSWSAGEDMDSLGGLENESLDVHSDSGNEKLDSVSAAGLEMVELLLLSAEVLKEYTAKIKPGHS